MADLQARPTPVAPVQTMALAKKGDRYKGRK
jgi:hypothetical protein